MWNFFSRMGRRRAQPQRFRFTVIAPETRGQDETRVLRENINDLGATAALQQVIEASRPRNGRELLSQTTSLHVKTHVSAVSADSEEYIRNPYLDTGRRPPRQEGGPPSSPLAVAPPAQTASSSEDDYIEVDKPEVEELEEPQLKSSNLIADPLGTLLHVAAAGTLAAGSPGRQYITSGPPPLDQRGIFRAPSGSQSAAFPGSHATVAGCQQPRVQLQTPNE